MLKAEKNPVSQLIVYLFILSSGFATLSWEVIWQIKSSLALGVSAEGAAITLAVMMGGMSFGALCIGKWIHRFSALQAIRIYGLLEIAVGITGLFINPAFKVLEKIDSAVYAAAPGGDALAYLVGIVIVLAIPVFCMGATFPLFGLIAKQFESSITKFYSLNVLGGVIGVLFVGLALIPWVGMNHAIWTIAGINILIGISAWLLTIFFYPSATENSNTEKISEHQNIPHELLIIFITGFATFTLEIAWFRSLKSIFQNTADIFAMMLACVLIALGLAAKNVSKLKQKKKSLGAQLSLAGIIILLTTPLLEHVDLLLALPSHLGKHAIPQNTPFSTDLGFFLDPDTFAVNWLGIFGYAGQMIFVFFITFLILFPAMRLLGVAFPWIIDNHQASQKLGKLYAISTFAAVIGAIGTAWILLPLLGFAKSAWLAGVLVVMTGVLITPNSIKRFALGVLGVIALMVAITFESGIGTSRVQGTFANLEDKPAKVLKSIESSDATISAIEYQDGTRTLLINSSSASAESGHIYRPSVHYMPWMGHLPMLLHPNPKNALVICFGIGQTANAVRKENPQSLDIVDINPQIFKLAHYFKSNENVLQDPKVNAIMMDGRAFLRRTKKTYDVITLEPMPPITVGVNALYSREFYALARERMSANGVIAQWLPFPQLAPHYAASIAKTFNEVFPNSVLWIDPQSKTGILLGTKDNNAIFASAWPGFVRTLIKRDMSINEVQQNLALNSKELNEYSKYGEIITDDNQLLSYGKALYANLGLMKENFELLRRANPGISN